jgi:AAA ATPase domain
MNDKKTAKHEVFLESIGLQNFQTFHEYQEIPIGNMTFIYGPNSAGKSAVIDAVEILLDIWSNDNSDSRASSPFAMELSNKLRRSKRRENDNFLHKELARLVVTISIPNQNLATRISQEDYSNSLYDLAEIINTNELEDDLGRTIIRAEIRVSNSSIEELLISVNGSPLLQYSTGFAINLNHPWLLINNFHQENKIPGITKVFEQVRKPEGFFRLNEGWLSYNIPVFCLPNRAISLDENFYFYIEDSINELPENVRQSVDWDSTIEAFSRFGRIYNELIGVFSKVIGDGLAFQRISGSRQIPTREDLTFFLMAGNNSKAYRESYGISLNGSPIYQELAKSALTRYLTKLASSHTSDKEYKENLAFILRFGSTEISDHVNDALRDHLLLDRSYQIESEVNLLIDPKLLLNKKERTHYELSGPYIVNLVLIDSAGNTFDFDEVGSGLGYMLPILIGINSNDLAIVEQPELHLHPALQGALADIFIECCNRGSRTIIESHSEHILLRALRRVRETSNDKIKSPTLSIQPDQLCVLYFDPSINGGTKVKRIRVSKEGDFLDYWPNGFFDERRKDLFDE